MDFRIWPNAQNVQVNSTAAIYCHSHVPPSWYLNGEKIISTNNTLFFEAISWGHDGMYTCLGKDNLGIPFKVVSHLHVEVLHLLNYLATPSHNLLAWGA